MGMLHSFGWGLIVASFFFMLTGTTKNTNSVDAIWGLILGIYIIEASK
jgi:steroid 5-alpha reductase family enzyme